MQAVNFRIFVTTLYVCSYFNSGAGNEIDTKFLTYTHYNDRNTMTLKQYYGVTL